MFEALAGAKRHRTFGDGYVKAGRYLMRVDKVKAGKNRQQMDNVAIEMTVLHVFADGPQPHEGQRAHKVGDNCADVISQKQGDYFLPRIKAFLAAVMNISDDSKIDARIAELATSEAQPLKGLVIEVVGVPKITVGAKKPIVDPEHRGQVPVSTIVKVMPPDALQAFFPADELEKLAKRQAVAGIK
jgi:hypothetical protein